MRSESRAAKDQLGRPELGVFFENLGMMLRAGISVNEAAEILRDENAGDDSRLTAALDVIARRTSEGSSLADSMRESGAFPDYAVDMTDAAEYAGKLEDTLFHLADYYRNEVEMRNALLSAVRYPIILLMMVIAVLLVMRILVFPAFIGVYDKLTGSLGASSYSHISVSIVVCDVLLVVMAVIVVLLIAGLIAWRNGGQASVRRVLQNVPIFKKLFDNLDLYRFTSCFDIFISCGEMQDEALKKSISVVEGTALEAKLERCAALMQEGAGFSQAAYEEKLYDPINNRMLIPAQRSGMLDSVLQKILGNLKENNQELTARITNTAEPLITGILMVLIGVMLVSVITPLIGIMNSIG